MRHGMIVMGFTVLFAVWSGCVLHKVNDPLADVKSNHVIYYCDGAGGGDKVGYGNGVIEAAEDVGWKGQFVIFPWNTGKGLVQDQVAPVAYKREQAEKLAKLIKADLDQGKIVSVVGFSAGAAPAVYAVEQLPDGYRVNNVVLLSSSLSQEYDLNDALRKIKKRMIVTTSEKDKVLLDMVPLVKTADCVSTKKGACSGAYGFRRPANADTETILLYDKIINIPWIPIFADYGNDGSHFGAVNRQFVRDVLLPIIWANMDSGKPMPKEDKTGL